MAPAKAKTTVGYALQSSVLLLIDSLRIATSAVGLASRKKGSGRAGGPKLTAAQIIAPISLIVELLQVLRDSQREERKKMVEDGGSGSNAAAQGENDNDHLIHSEDPQHPANLICELCRKFYTLGWVTGTGGGTSIRHGDHIFLAPSGVQKELMQPTDMFVMELATKHYLRRPPVHKPSQCTPLFLAAFTLRGAGCCIHTHSQWAVLVTLLVERESGRDACFEIEEIEQIKGIPKGNGKVGNLGYYDRLRVPIIENTAHEEDLTETLESAIEQYPDTYAVLVRRHGIYVWGDNVHKAKTQCESLDYIFQLAVEMKKLGLPWTKGGEEVADGKPPKRSRIDS